MHCFVSIVVLLVIVLKNCPSFSNGKATDEFEGCHPQRKLVFSTHWRKLPVNYTLDRVSIQCSAPNTVFDIRYSNNLLCVCGRLVKEKTARSFPCRHKTQDLNVNITVSVDQVANNHVETCNVTLHYVHSEKDSAGILLRLTITILGRNVVNPAVLPSTTMSSVLKTFNVAETTLNGVIFTLAYTSSKFASRTPSYDSTTIPATLLSSSTPVKEISTHSLTEPVKDLPTYTLSTPTAVPSTHSSSKPILSSSLSVEMLFPYSPSVPIGERSTDISSILTKALPTDPSVVTSSLLDFPVFKVTPTIQVSPTTISFSSDTTLSPIDHEDQKYNEDVDYINKVNTSAVNINDKKTIQNVLDAATNVMRSNRTTEDGEDPGLKAVNVLKDLGMTLSKQLELGNNSQVIFQQTTQDFVFGVAAINTSISSGFKFPDVENNRAIGDETIEIPQSVFATSTGQSYFVGIIYKAVREMRNKTGDGGFSMGSKVINAVVSPPPSANLEDPVEMTFEKNWVGPSVTEDCSFWIENSSISGEHGRWSTYKCKQVFQNKTHIKCACHHFTNFAVLFKITDDQGLSEEDAFRLLIITYVGLGLSVLGCFLTFVIYVTFSNIKSDRSTIHTNLVVALGVADVIFLVTVAVKPVKNTCLIIAMLAFYFYLAVFFWMLVEGIYIYLMVIKVFRGNVRRRRRLAFLVGWGCPLIIVVVTWAVLRDDVVSRYHCWLSVTSGAIWAFVGPGLFIIFFNVIVLMTVMRTTWATFVDDKEYGGLKSATKTFGAVIPILGVTWVFGVMAFNETSAVFQYIFAITNSIQGMLIFILYCLVNKEVRQEIRRRITVWKIRRDVSSSSGTRRPTYMASSEKMTTFNRTTQLLPATPDLSRHPLREMMEHSENIEKNSSFKTFGCLVNDSEKREIAAEPAISSKEEIMRQNLERHNSPLGEPKDSKLENRLQSSVGYI